MELGTWKDGLRPIARMVNKVLMMLTSGAGALGGVMLADHIWPRNNTAFTVLAVAGVAIGVAVWWPVNRTIARWLGSARS